MPAFWVSSPYINLRLEDVPLWWIPGKGQHMLFHLSYRQRGQIPEDPTIFGLGSNWSCSFRAFVLSLGGTPESLQLHRGGSGWITYTNGVTQYLDGSILTTVTGGYQITYPNGARDVFTHSFVSSTNTYHFLSSHVEPAGPTTLFTYSSTPGIAQLASILDSDGKTASFYYQNTTYTNQITMVVDPYSRTNRLAYDNNGYLTNIVDVAGLSTSFIYDSSNPGWITNMTTPYGTTSFSFGGVDVNNTDFYTGGGVVNRWLLASLPNGGNHLYLYRQDCNGVISSTYPTVPSTSPFGNTLDNVDQENRNSFHWDPLQYSHLSTTDPTMLSSGDYALAHLYHWLTNAASPDPSCTLSLERLPSPDGSTSGQLTWYDYFGKSGGNNFIGTNIASSLVAVVLPDGTTRYSRYTRNAYDSVTQDVSTYSKTDGTVGRRTNSFYYASNNIDLLQRVGPNNEQVVSNYFSAGNTFHQPDAKYDALNQQTAYTYNSSRQVTSVTPPTLLTTTNLYFTSGSSMNRLQYSYDFNGSQTFRSNAFTYSSGLVQTLSDERGVTLTKYWDNLQRLTGVSYPDGTSVSNIYTFLDRTATKDRMNFWTYFGYDSIRNKIAETNADNVVTRYGYCECGALMDVTNAWSTSVQFVTSYNFDYQENRTYVYLPDFTITNYFNSMRQLIRQDAENGSRYFYYNNQGLQTNISDVYGTERGTIFDNEDRPVYVTDANGVTTTNTYDLLGRVLTRGYPDGGVEKFGYSAFGLTALTNQIGMTNYFAYDAGTRKAFETNADHQLIQYYYDASGNLTNLLDGKNQSTKWNYDEYSRLTNKLDQAGTVVLKYIYDADNRLTNRWSLAKGNTIYTYDALGNLTLINYPSSPDVTLQYDLLNRLTNMVDAVGTTKYTYAGGGELFTEDGPFASDTVTNGYLNRLRVSLSLQEPTGVWTNKFIYDAVARLTNVTSQAGSFGYTPGALNPSSTLIKKLLLPNTAYITNTFDTVARLTGTFLDNSTNFTLDSATYGYNVASQRTTFTNAAGTYVQYAYDPLGQLTIGTSSVTTENRGYLYDSAWNLNWLTNNGSASQFKVDTRNELTNWAGTAATYDSNGNRITSGSGTGSFSYTYDDENRLISIVQSPTIFRTDFAYDGLGRLRTRIEYSWNGSAWTANTTINYIYDGTRVIQERNGNNGASDPLVSYTRGLDLSGTLEGVGGIGGLLARSSGYSAGNWSTHYFYHADGNGNITYLVDSSQALAASYRYDPYGNITASSGAQASANVYRFSSKEQHVNSGLYIYLYRFYDPNTLRWLNRDPLGEWGGYNLYRFVYESPLSYIDPDGLTPTGAGIGGAIGGAIGGVLGGIVGAAGGTLVLPGGGTIAGGAELGVTGFAAGGALGAAAGNAISDLWHNIFHFPGSTPPFQGQPGSTAIGGTQTTEYGPDGYPIKQRDWPHPGEAPPSNADHCHDWSRPSSGGPPVGPPNKPNPFRGPPRPPTPGDPPPPRGPGVPPPPTT
jgi:RHS repeat-associated protein